MEAPYFLANDGYYQSAIAASISEFTQVDSLPCPQIKSAIDDRYRNGAAHECGFDMGGHIVRTFESVGKKRKVFRYKVVENRIKIDTDRRVSILIDCEAR